MRGSGLPNDKLTFPYVRGGVEGLIGQDGIELLTIFMKTLLTTVDSVLQIGKWLNSFSLALQLVPEW